MATIKCTKCGDVGPYPDEWLECNGDDRGYLEDGYTCGSCWDSEGAEQYYRNGMAELIGY